MSSGQTQNWTIPTDAFGAMQAQEKRLSHEERRPRITKASDLMGPGLAAQAVTLEDLTSDTASFNGFWYVPTGAVGSPDDTKEWMGFTIANRTDGGVQVLWTFNNADAPHATMQRGFDYAVSGGTRFYSVWAAAGGSGGEEDRIALPTTAGWTVNASIPAYYRKISPTLVKLGGEVLRTPAADISTSNSQFASLPVGYRPPVNGSWIIPSDATSGAGEWLRVVMQGFDGALLIRAMNSATTATRASLDGIIIDISDAL